MEATPSIERRFGGRLRAWPNHPTRRLAGLLNIRAGEGVLVCLLGALFALIEMARGLGEVAADSLFVSRFGLEYLPWLYVVLGVATLVVGVGYAGGIGRFDRRRLMVAVPLAVAALLLVERVLLAGAVPLALPVLWLTVEVANTILLTFLWTTAGTTLDARQAKRLFPVCMGAAIAGAFAGTLAAGPIARVIGTENLLPIVSLLLVAAAAIAAGLASRFDRPVTSVARDGGIVRELRAGYEDLARSSLMRLVALAYVLFSVLFFLVSFSYFEALSVAFGGREAELTAFLGVVSAATTLVAFVASVTLASRLFARFGVATAALLLPLVYLAGFTVWLTNFALSSVIAVRLVLQVTQRGVTNAAWSALFNVVPLERRARVMAFADGVPSQVGISLAGVLLIVLMAVASPVAIAATGLVAAIACSLIVVAIRRRYGSAIVAALRQGTAEQVLEGGPGLGILGRDPQVRSRLTAALTDPDPSARRLAAEVLGRLRDRDSTGALEERLADSDPEVRAAALQALLEIGPEHLPSEGVRRALDDEAAVVRVAAIRASSRLDRCMVVHVETLTADPDPRVRAELAVALESSDRATSTALVADLIGSSRPEDRVAGILVLPMLRVVDAEGRRALLAALDDDTARVREAAARALAGMADAQPNLVAILDTGSDWAQEAAVAAMAGQADPPRDAIGRWFDRQVARAELLRRAARALEADPNGSSAEPGSNRDFLEFLLEHRVREIEDRLIRALVALGAADSAGVIRRSLRSTDPDVGAQAIEAIEATGDRRLARAFTHLLEGDDSARPDVEDVTRCLTRDPDSWIRTLAIRTLTERGGSAMHDTRPTLGIVDRMLFLRRVPLFGQLGPEDLQRIAAVAVERIYLRDDELVHEGDAGDELIVIAEGRVRVVRNGSTGTEILRVCGAGDHVGELAVLTSGRRSASVIATGADVRGLVIAGDALRSIVRERPEAAMAMLVTLAERIGGGGRIGPSVQ